VTLRTLAIGLALVALATACGKKSSQATTSTGTTTTVTYTETVTTETQTYTVTVTGQPPMVIGGHEPVLPPGAHLLTTGGPLGATGLVKKIGCQQGKGVARLSWTPAAEPGSAQRVAVTVFPEVADPRDFELVRALPATADVLVWTSLSGQANHTWTVLTRHPEGWAPSARVTFTGPACTADMNSP
jgi:hypothetical protein